MMMYINPLTWNDKVNAFMIKSQFWKINIQHNTSHVFHVFLLFKDGILAMTQKLTEKFSSVNGCFAETVFIAFKDVDV
jgi:hypothetical protein